MTIDFVAEAKEIAPDLIALRRELHADPELGNDLPRTQKRVLDALAGLPVEITLGKELSSIIAVLRGSKPGPTVLLRGDMDALPVVEETDVPFAATNGNMLACGHDLHTAGLVGAVRLLSAHQEELSGTVVFMFQPGEEGPGGAKPMLDEGLLTAAGAPVDAAFALHVLPGEQGVFECRPGTAMAGSNYLRVTFNGEGGHGSKPETATDPVPPLVEFCQALQVMITRRFSVLDPVVLSITTLKGGEALNVIPPSASMGGTVRTLSHETTQKFPQYAKQLADNIAQAHNCTVDFDWEQFYPVTVNTREEVELVNSTLTNVFGQDRFRVPEEPVMGSEDFSFVLQEVPGAYLMLQASPPEVDPATAAYNHSPLVLFDDAVLADQAAALAHIAWAYNVRGDNS